MLNILFVHVHVVYHFLFGKVREFCTISRPDGIDVTHIGLAVQELTGRAAVHPFPLPVFIQPFFPELLNGHIEVFGNALQVFKSVCGSHGATAIGTGQAINLFPNGTIYYIGIHI
jgi:hypothetical protein